MSKSRLATSFVLILATLALTVGLAARPGRAADHLDAPTTKKDGRTDINDVYVFHPGDPQDLSRTVLVMTVNPAAGVISGDRLRPGALYEFLIDTNGDAVQDLAYRLKFSGGKDQEVHLKRAEGAQALGDNSGKQIAQGPVEETIPVEGGGSLFIGLRDDPFFFDLASFNAGATFCEEGDSDFFLGLNVTAIVLEVPTSALGSSIGVWGRTVVDDAQVDRMGRPAILTVFIPPNPFEPGSTSVGNLEDAFNATAPADDPAMWTAEVVNSLLFLSGLDGSGYTLAEAEAIAGILLPDILTADLSTETGFLNGRGLADDVIDLELFVVTGGLFGGSPVLTTDCVDNDSTFLADFPYVGVPNP